MSETVHNTHAKTENPLGKDPVGRLLIRFSIPSVIALVVNSLYNIVDQIFIGNFVGELGNAATNIAFPLTILYIAISLLFGVGGASAFNLAMVRGEKEQAPYYMGNSILMLIICGVSFCVVTLVFLNPLLRVLGSPDNVFPYAHTYVSIIAYGFPFVLFSGGASPLIRADGRPRCSMFCTVSGAIVNVVLDALFVAVLGWGMAGAAAATVIGQVVAAALAAFYVCRMRTVKLMGKHLRLQRHYVTTSARLGTAACVNQLAIMVVQITMNNSLNHYGGMSIYGEAVPIAVVGIITKVNQIFLSIQSGIGQGSQPIASFNYGAKQYDRVRSAFSRAIVAGICVGVVSFLLYQIFPRQIISLFGQGSSELYYQFAIRYFRIYLMLAAVNFLPHIACFFFTAIGKPTRGIIVALTRQIIFFLPLLLIFPAIMGIDGIMYVGPVADSLAVTVTTIMLAREMRDLKRRSQGIEP